MAREAAESNRRRRVCRAGERGSLPCRYWPVAVVSCPQAPQKYAGMWRLPGSLVAAALAVMRRRKLHFSGNAANLSA